MKRKDLMIVLLSLSFTAIAAFAETDTSLESLRWMTGSWYGTVDGVAMEEHWLEPKGGIMLGVHRDIISPSKTAFEFLRIAQSKEGVGYLASPGGNPATRFALEKIDGERVVFSNPDHDFPQRVIYWRKAPDTLCARVEGMINGKQQGEQWCWNRGPMH